MRSLLAALAVAVLGAGSTMQAAEAQTGHGTYAREMRPLLVEQSIEVRFRSPEDAAAARFSIAPLPGGAEWAVSGRWDDNIPGNAEANRRMADRGIHPTFYLNSNQIWHQRGSDYAPEARTLLEFGAGIGGHGLTHPYLAGTSTGRAFYEALAVRIEWESLLDAAVSSYAFSFISYRNRIDGADSQADIYRALDRAGYNHLAIFKHADDLLPSDFEVTPILPPENQPLEDFARAIDWLSGSEEVRERHASFSNSMHAWYGTPALEFGWEELDRRIDLLADRPGTWYANHTAIGGYRFQARHASIEDARADGGAAFLRLRRPSLVDANDPAPLSIRVDGVDADAIVAVLVDGIAVDAPAAGAPAFLDIPRPGDAMPGRVLHYPSLGTMAIPGPAPLPKHLDGMHALLEKIDSALSIIVRNDTDEALEGITIRWRVPIRHQAPPPTAVPFALGPGEEFSIEQPLVLRTARELDAHGLQYYAAQVDARLGGERIRIHATDARILDWPQSLPDGRFAALGPIPREDLDWPSLRAAFDGASVLPREWTSPRGIAFRWRESPRDGNIPSHALSPEILRTTGDWYKLWCDAYVLATEIHSHGPREARLLYYEEDSPFVLLNGLPVEDGRLRLRSGWNLLVIPHFFEVPDGDPRHVGCFIRLVDPSSGERLRDIRYRIPALPGTRSR